MAKLEFVLHPTVQRFEYGTQNDALMTAPHDPVNNHPPFCSRHNEIARMK